MADAPLITASIGSFPKPEDLPIEDWFDVAHNLGGMGTPLVTQRFTACKQNRSSDAEALFVRAAKEIIDLQVDAGIAIPTDGEVRRDNYIHYHCRHLDGFDFRSLEHRILRDGAYKTNISATRRIIKHEGRGYVAHDYIASQNVSPAPVKFTLPSPLTIMDTTADSFYHDRPRLNRELAETVNKEIIALVDAGCRYIKVDEPLFARQVQDALDFGIEKLERYFHGTPDNTTKIVHMCCGYPDHLDDDDYKKADPDSHHRLARHFDAIGIDQVSIEDAQCCNDLTLFESFENVSIIFGSVSVARSRVETVDNVEARIRSAPKYIDRERLVIAPDCGLGLLPPELALAKLKVMCAAAGRICKPSSRTVWCLSPQTGNRKVLGYETCHRPGKGTALLH